MIVGIRELSSPTRIQLSRRKGFDLQALSQATNGLPAVVVARPSRWGNPFVIGKDVASAAEAVKEFRGLTAPHPPHVVPLYMGLDDIARDLHGKNLACWCKPGAPCHADVLLELANRPICEAVEGSGQNLADAHSKNPPETEHGTV